MLHVNHLNFNTMTKIEAYTELNKIAQLYNDKCREGRNYGWEICYDPTKNRYELVSLGYIRYSGVRFNRKVDAEFVKNNPDYRFVLDTLYK